MKTWEKVLLILTLGYCLVSGAGWHSAEKKVVELTAQRDSIAELHTRSMVEWAALQRAMQTQVARATKAYADGARDFDTVFEAGMGFGAYLERYTYDITNGGEHWGMETAP